MAEGNIEYFEVHARKHPPNSIHSLNKILFGMKTHSDVGYTKAERDSVRPIIVVDCPEIGLYFPYLLRSVLRSVSYHNALVAPTN